MSGAVRIEGEGKVLGAFAESSNLEIHISRRGVDQYTTELRFSAAGTESDNWYAGLKYIHFAYQTGADAEIDPREVGKQIRDDLCSDPGIAEALGKILASVDALGDPLHVRLFIDPGAAELQLIPWETLVEPGGDQFMFAGERRSFSRFLASSDFRRIEMRSSPIPKAAIIIANPATTAAAPFDVASQLAMARAAVAGLQITEHASGGFATLDAIVESVRDGNDLLFVIGHGAITDGEPYLWLEKPDGEVDRVRAEDLIERLQGLRERPRLVVLFSCRSGGDDIQFHASLGPRLAAIGVPAVLAMRGDVPIESAREFLIAFFRELRAHGSLDRAVSYARRAVEDAGAAWMPVLFTRLRSGRIWYRPGFVRDDSDASKSERWDALVSRIAVNKCTPIIGPLLTEPLIGSFRDIALRWSNKFGFPLAPQDRENLTSVAQYLATNQYSNRPRELFLEHVREELWENFGPRLGLKRDAPLDAMLEAGWKAVSRDNPDEPHRVLARLPLSRYLTTNTNLLLEKALLGADKRPVSELYRWDEQFSPKSIFTEQPDYNPTIEQPLVFHLFGHMDVDDSGPLLTEDDYFDYLIMSATNRDQMPPTVRASLLNSTLLFLGFQIDDWSFRVLFRSLMNHQNKKNVSRFGHIAVQVDPEEGRILEPGRARRYLESYFEQMGRISIFWGSAEEFTRELGKQWDAHQARAAEE